MYFSTFLEIAALGLLIAAAIIVSLVAPEGGKGAADRIERRVSRFAQHRKLCVIALCAAVLGIRLALLPIWHIPRPAIHDEFAYLFGAETFALGRLTNPTPPNARFFEAPHVLVTPSFQSRYPPGQSLVLAAGQALFGNAWFGVLLSCAAMSAAICWMLQGWMPARWALLGGLLSILRLATFSYWMNSYWGGAAAAIGGCLVMGAYPRIVRRGQSACAWTMGAGLLILAITRPLEGAITSLPVGIALLHAFWFGRRPPLGVRWQAVAGRLAVCLIVGASFIAYYNYRVTNNALRLPHVEFARQYANVPMLVTGKVVDKGHKYFNDDMAYQYALWEPATEVMSQQHFLYSRGYDAMYADQETLGILLTMPLLVIPLALRDRRVRLMLCCLLLMCLIMLAENSASLHYAAPQIGSFFGLLVQCFRHLRAGRHGAWNVIGRFLSRALPVASVLVFTEFGIIRGAHSGWTDSLTPIQHRPEIESRLVSSGNGNAIVFVRYHFDPGTVFSFEDWNYNSPDLEHAPVLWVHDLGESEDKALMQEFPERTPWYCTVECSKKSPMAPVFQTTAIRQTIGQMY